MNCSSLSRCDVGVGLVVAPLDVRDHALVGGPVRALPAVAVPVPDVDLLVASRTGGSRGRLLGEPLPRRVEVEAVGARRRPRARGPSTPAWPLAHGASAPSCDRQVGVGHDELGVDLEPRAEAVAGRARAVRRVEREVPRRQLVEARCRSTCTRATARSSGSPRGPSWVCDGDRGDALGELERGLDRVGHAPADVGLGDQPVDHDLDRVLVGLRQPDRLARGRGPRRRSGRGGTPCAPARRAACSYSPLRPRTTGASTWNLVPSGSSITWSTIWSGVWRPIGRPHLGQCGCPTRAYSTRR